MDDQVALLGIRHHGPGCAHALRLALQQLQPDVILLEGAEELDSSWPLMASAGMKPPVAQLVYDPKQPQRCVIYPWAEFSPEWQAMRYASEQGIPLRMIDLPAGIRLAAEDNPEKADADANSEPDTQADAQAAATSEPVSADVSEAEEELAEEELAEEEQADEYAEPLPNSSQMLDRISASAGFADHEVWWDASIERHSGNLAMFEALQELMTEARNQYEQELQQREHFTPAQQQHLQLEQQREAWMRTQLRKARKEFQRIVVICGAWHVPALAAKVAVKDDNAVLKGLKKQKLEVAWVPYNFQRLSQDSGYGAGVESPAWYQHLFSHHQSGSDAEQTSIQWLIRTAGILRQHGFDCSSAHVIEAVRLAMNLAALRGQATPGLQEMLDATRSVMTEGRQGPLDQIFDRLVIGDCLGELPAEIPSLPIEQDLDAEIRRLRLKKLSTQELLSLDLRKDSGLERSQLLHRLQVLDIPWGKHRHSSGTGTFKEDWLLQWQPEFAISLLDASLLGNTVLLASQKRLVEQLADSQQVADVVELINRMLLCHLPDAVHSAVEHLQSIAAVSADLQDMMSALLPLVQLMRYGSVRKLDADALDHVVDSMIIRICNGLTSASACLDRDSSYRMLEAMEALHSAIKLLDSPDYNQRWIQALADVSVFDGVHAVLRGRSSRMLHDQQGISDETLNQRFRLNVSACADPEQAAAWVEGLLLNAAAAVLYDDVLFSLLDDWLMQLADDDYLRVLPMLRRSLSEFSSTELQQIGDRVLQGSHSSHDLLACDYSDELAQQAIATLSRLLGLGSTPISAATTGVTP
ncbi:DUF5682 family protein [Parathalassolituus penaei]|uniref:DUF5682 family protein n=1 Tax=Parathalassolituus penaei TaxID=2997323 RepID=A0A9X3IS32_9GAMM|nr:DUF5682 family protein [Parathalassolituus penaei]MCY0964865.1 DUF5682 family protein [Parathalassolituus penaei]